MKLTRKTYTTRNEKIIDFAIGFVGIIIFNAVMWLINFGIAMLFPLLVRFALHNDAVWNLAIGAGLIFPLAQLLINLALLIFFALTRKWIAAGMLAFLVLLFVVALCGGLLVAAACSLASIQSSLPH